MSWQKTGDENELSTVKSFFIFTIIQKCYKIFTKETFEKLSKTKFKYD
jgi:hypothetical protein